MEYQNKWFTFRNMPLDKQTIEKYANNLRDAAYAAEAAKRIYFDAIHDFVLEKLYPDIYTGVKITIHFADGDNVVQFDGVCRGRIDYYHYTKKGKVGKTLYHTSWTMWEHMEKF